MICTKIPGLRPGAMIQQSIPLCMEKSLKDLGVESVLTWLDDLNKRCDKLMNQC